MTTNLPNNNDTSSLREVKSFFDKFHKTEVTFPSEEIDAVIGFFQRRNFDIDSARATGIVFLNQARLDNVPVFTLLESLKSLPSLQLNQVVAQILNSYREPTSLLGYRIKFLENTFESRNILV
jgi:hypothetical protein